MSPIVLECKRMCLTRCLKAVALSLAMQFLLLTVFVYFVNFQLLHPFEWLTKTIGLVISVYTWFSAVPLLTAVAGYGVILGKLHLARRKFYTKRIYWLLDTGLRKLLFLGVHVLVGLLTAWLYTSFMHADYQSVSYQCYQQRCLNGRFVFLIYMGMTAGVYHFCKQNWLHEPHVEYPIIQQPKWVRVRTLLWTTLYTTTLKSCVPTLLFAAVYWLFGSLINARFARIVRLDIDLEDGTLLAIATDWRLLFYAWILAAQILSNMNLMHRFFSILLGEQMSFPVERSAMLEDTAGVVTLADALGCRDVPVVQHLACLDLYHTAVGKHSEKRQAIFTLSVPGSHPYNWNTLSKECLSLIGTFTDELKTAIKGISTLRECPMYQQSQAQPAALTAEKILMRQYNQMYGIRNMTHDMQPSATDQPPEPPQVNTLKVRLERIGLRLEELRQRLCSSVPGYVLLFGDVDGAHAVHLLSHSQHISWLCQGLAGICTASVTEDMYGVVQGTLPHILKALLELKQALDVLNNVSLNGRKVDRNFVSLKSAVKRSLYKICSVFGDYLNDLCLEPEDCRQLHHFVSYQET